MDQKTKDLIRLVLDDAQSKCSANDPEFWQIQAAHDILNMQRQVVVVVVRGGLVENVAALDPDIDVVIVDYDRDEEDRAYYEKPIKYSELHPDSIGWVEGIL